MEYYESKYTGAEVDALLDKVNSGEVGGKVTVDSALSTESENPVMNKVITEELNKLKETVIKTTPQTLSADAKNQALANLGIDPIVWKYICNPLILGDYLLEIPLELRDIILGDYSEEFGYTLKPIASSLIKIYNGAGFTSIATFGNGQDYNIDFENNNFIINNHYEIEFV